jgi:hypothetical protein
MANMARPMPPRLGTIALHELRQIFLKGRIEQIARVERGARRVSDGNGGKLRDIALDDKNPAGHDRAAFRMRGIIDSRSLPLSICWQNKSNRSKEFAGNESSGQTEGGTRPLARKRAHAGNRHQ